MTRRSNALSTVGRGVLAGVAGTAVMTAFQRLVEMPLTHRPDSLAPAQFAQRVLPLNPSNTQDLKRLNIATHYALGTLWGCAYGVAARAGLRGQKAVNAVFVAVYTGDVVLNTALGLYHPTEWSAQDWVVDLVDKYVQAQATDFVFDRFLDPTS